MKFKKIQEREEINLKLQNKKKQKLKEKGITLIALVVTIIILLILAGVTLNMALSGDGLFSRARNAADKYKKAQEDEEKLISEIETEMYNQYVGTYVTGYEPTEGTYTIPGAKVGLENNIDKDGKEIAGVETNGNQIFKTEEMKWRIWDYDGNTLRIISEKMTTDYLTLNGANGYNNGVWAMNEICRKCYGKYEQDDNNKEMKKGISVENLKRSDIEKVNTYDYTKYRDGDYKSDGSGNPERGYGDSFDIKGTDNVPKIWNLNDKNWLGGKSENDSGNFSNFYFENEYVKADVSCNGVDNFSGKVFWNGYVRNFFGKGDDFIDENYLGILNENYIEGEPGYSFWLSSRCVEFSTIACFAMCKFDIDHEWESISRDNLYRSDKNSYCKSYGLRPVVSIDLEKAGLELEKVYNDKEKRVELEIVEKNP